MVKETKNADRADFKLDTVLWSKNINACGIIDLQDCLIH